MEYTYFLLDDCICNFLNLFVIRSSVEFCLTSFQLSKLFFARKKFTFKSANKISAQKLDALHFYTPFKYVETLFLNNRFKYDFSKFRNLKKLVVKRHSGEVENVSNLTNLTALQIGYATYDIGNLTNLIKLCAIGYNYQKILYNNINVTSLKLNRVFEADLTVLTKLCKLKIFNPDNRCNFIVNSNYLTYIEISYDKVDSFKPLVFYKTSLNSLTSLNCIKISHGFPTNIIFDMYHLKTIIFCNISDELNIQKLTHLKYLKIKECINFNLICDDLTNLEYLKIKLTNSSTYNNMMLNKLSKLTFLHLKLNTYVHNLSNLVNLKSIILKNLRLDTLFNLTKLYSLSLSLENIKLLNELTLLKNIKQIYLSKNNSGSKVKIPFYDWIEYYF